ncbi:hypothetical protein MHH28_01105 [Paenibacillus sp. FSL K6-1217]|uniref:hypothetical protein n=1 Tax=Paenibacillus sp. FSL K6-1217 TaxID=2921466 RepID=UPI0032459A1E
MRRWEEIGRRVGWSVRGRGAGKWGLTMMGINDGASEGWLTNDGIIGILQWALVMTG